MGGSCRGATIDCPGPAYSYAGFGQDVGWFVKARWSSSDITPGLGLSRASFGSSTSSWRSPWVCGVRSGGMRGASFGDWIQCSKGYPADDCDTEWIKPTPNHRLLSRRNLVSSGEHPMDADEEMVALTLSTQFFSVGKALFSRYWFCLGNQSKNRFFSRIASLENQ